MFLIAARARIFWAFDLKRHETAPQARLPVWAQLPQPSTFNALESGRVDPRRSTFSKSRGQSRRTMRKGQADFPLRMAGAPGGVTGPTLAPGHYQINSCRCTHYLGKGHFLYKKARAGQLQARQSGREGPWLKSSTKNTFRVSPDGVSM
jgi:hypothetical protein